MRACLLLTILTPFFFCLPFRLSAITPVLEEGEAEPVVVVSLLVELTHRDGLEGALRGSPPWFACVFFYFVTCVCVRVCVCVCVCVFVCVTAVSRPSESRLLVAFMPRLTPSLSRYWPSPGQ